LKRSIGRQAGSQYAHQEQVPRKQGLKQESSGICLGRDGCHQEQVPRKQGLKLGRQSAPGKISGTSRASSTKTRIETPVISPQGELINHIKSKFHENKD